MRCFEGDISDSAEDKSHLWETVYEPPEGMCLGHQRVCVWGTKRICVWGTSRNSSDFQRKTTRDGRLRCLSFPSGRRRTTKSTPASDPELGYIHVGLTFKLLRDCCQWGSLTLCKYEQRQTDETETKTLKRTHIDRPIKKKRPRLQDEQSIKLLEWKTVRKQQVYNELYGDTIQVHGQRWKHSKTKNTPMP